tara:strand:+ start:1920 stop:2828 length:909 start_codon:yes stop_codon:yes gene_type:complete
MPTIEDLKKLSLKTLRSEVSKTNIKNYSSLKKADLIVVMLKPEHIQRFHHLSGGVIEPPMPKKKVIIRKPKAEPATVPKKKIIIRKPVAEPAMPKKKVIIRKRVPLNTVTAGDISDLGRGKVSTAKYIPSADETPAPKKVKIIKKTVVAPKKKVIIKKTVAAPKKVKIIKKTKTTMKRLVVKDEPDSDDESKFPPGKSYPIIFLGKDRVENSKLRGKSYGTIWRGDPSMNTAVYISPIEEKTPKEEDMSFKRVLWNITADPFITDTPNFSGKVKFGSWFFKNGIIFVDYDAYLKRMAPRGKK